MKKCIFVLFVLILFTSCSFINIRSRTSRASHDTTNNIVSDTLYTAQSYLRMGLEAEEMGDSLGADYFIGKAVEYADSFKEAHSLALDSTSQKSLKKIDQEYEAYLTRLNSSEQDTLSAARVMNTLETLQDSTLAKKPDSTEVTIQDVMGETEQLKIPLELNKKVENVIRYFRGKGKKVFTTWLRRSGKYQKMVSRILKEEGVPSELFYLAMIESGFNPRARSYARAVGMWQFIRSTGRAYGLRNSWWYDERRDPEKATRAAARHLRDLHERFNDNWYLAIAGYNYSPGRIERKIRKYKVNDFWSLPRLPRQTRNYVPTFIASAIMAKEPEKYGFFVETEQPLEYDTVSVRECVDLNVVAKCVDTTYSALKSLNPALLRFCTPPDRDSWTLNIPLNTREKFLENYSKVPDKKKLTWIRHTIRSGETLSTIAARYGVNMYEIKRINKIHGTLIRAGHSLVIPVPQVKRYVARTSRRSSSGSYTRRKPVANVPNHKKQIHSVQKGETLWDISTKYGVKISEIRRWNGLSTYSRIIQPHQKLNIWLPIQKPLLARISPPKTEQPPKPALSPMTKSDGQTITYTVRNGDTFWDIADRFGVSTREIKKWNRRRSNLIRPGDQLKIVVPE